MLLTMNLMYFLLYLILSILVVVILVILVIKIWLEPVNRSCECTARLDGKVVVVTGGNAGIGLDLETARELARRGARVLIASRDTDRSRAAVADIITTTGNHRVDHRHLDLAQLSSVRRFAEDFNRTEPRLDILVNNAGCGSVESELTEDGIDVILQINYFGPFLLTNLLLNRLEAAQPSRIVILSSVMHRFCYLNVKNIADAQVWWRTLVYARSKLLQLLWMRALTKRVPPGVTVNAVHPGTVNTDIFNAMGPVSYLIRMIIALVFKTPTEGAQTSIHACLSPELGRSSGGYYADCRPSKVAAIVDDDRVVERVWEDSLMLTKCTNNFSRIE